MSQEDEKPSREHFKEGKDQLEKGTQKILEEGIEKGKHQTKKIEYYQNNRSELIRGFSSKLNKSKKPAASGTVVLLPLFAVFLVVGWLFEKLAEIPGNQYFNISSDLAAFINPNGVAAYYLNQTFKLGILLASGAVLVTLVGRAVRTGRGFKAEKMMDRLFDKIPFLGPIYNMTKVTTEKVLGGADDLSRPVKVNHGGIRINAFKTGNQTEDGREIVFMPTAPNITSGLVLELPEEKLEETGESAEEALTKILSAGFGQKEKQKGEESSE